MMWGTQHSATALLSLRACDGLWWAVPHQAGSFQAGTASSLSWSLGALSRDSPHPGEFRLMGKKYSLPLLRRLSGHSSYEFSSCVLAIGKGVAGRAGITVELFGDDFYPSVEVSHLSLGCQ